MSYTVDHMTGIPVTVIVGPYTIVDSEEVVTNSGDMLKSIYDLNENGIVDNAETIMGFTVAINVPSNALFTDTVYDDSILQNEVDINTAKVSYTDSALVATHTTDIAGKEDLLGNPSNDGKILTSTAAGVRSWITNTGGTGGQVNSVSSTNINALTVNSTDPINPTLSIVSVTPITSTNKLVTENEIAAAGGGDMLKNVYDTTDNNIVDNAEKVNNLTVQTAVPVGALFTDTLTPNASENIVGGLTVYFDVVTSKLYLRNDGLNANPN